ncbi:hypothetical protein NIIDMKKI_10760 [Mycobacterium kansasii]|uniref:Uncharacterized protein n=1 Tax=Mycobacterium kansasii TaxID=1768 RepID=A0A1V3XJJ4_MYCKA|nr:hypothetical protein BZL30_2924 [Mycobacterium kansasii]BCI85870.1 hypothetical protein NIIDMKKI_10760 [Mycobacterium kansasii]
MLIGVFFWFTVVGSLTVAMAGGITRRPRSPKPRPAPPADEAETPAVAFDEGDQPHDVVDEPSQPEDVDVSGDDGVSLTGEAESDSAPSARIRPCVLCAACCGGAVFPHEPELTLY